MENKFDVLKRMNDRRGSKVGATKPANVTFSAVSENDLDEKTSVKTSSDLESSGNILGELKARNEQQKNKDRKVGRQVVLSEGQIEAIKKLADLYYNGNFSKTLQEILDIALGLD
jgi:hypothetical protein